MFFSKEDMENDEKVVRQLKERIAVFKGRAFMPMLKGDPIEIFLSDDKDGIITKKLPNDVLTWDMFSALGYVFRNSKQGKRIRRKNV